MSNSTTIRSYKDLLEEKNRLKAQFSQQREALKAEASTLKDALNPVKKVANKVGMLTSPDKSMGLLNAGLTFVIDIVLKRFVLKKSGFIIKLLAPFLIRNALSRLAASRINEDMPALKSFLSKLPKKI